MSPEVAGKVVAIDGKTLRGSHDGGQSPIHWVSAFASEAGIVLGQVKTSEKSNEITAMKIIAKGGDYLLALKGNPNSLHDDVCLYFEQPAPASLTRMTRAETVDKGHGRIEIRQCRVSTDIDWLRVRHPEWKNLGSIVAIASGRRHDGSRNPLLYQQFTGSGTAAAGCRAFALYPLGHKGYRKPVALGAGHVFR